MKNYIKALISSDASIKQALQVIDSSSLQIALVVNPEAQLLGVLTDGDIRRALLKGSSMADPVGPLIKGNYRYVSNDTSLESAKEIMLRDSLSHLPVLDENKRIVDLYTWHNLLEIKKLSSPVVIMAGGKGTRLMPYTESCPKPMLLVDGKPMLQILLEQCISAGFESFYISVNYLKQQIIDYFGDGSRWGVFIDYLVEGEPLGTAGSLKLLPCSVKEPFLVLNGDVLTRLNPRHLLQFHLQHNALATLGVRNHEITVPFGVVQTNEVELVDIVEKPTYHHLVNAGVYVIDPRLLRLLPSRESADMPGLLLAAQQAGHRVAVCPIHEYWIDVGRPEALVKAHATWQDS